MIPAILPKKASIETCTTCNHACVYCPVSQFPVSQQVMDIRLFRRVLDELATLDRKMKRISFNHYNEPLVDPYLVERVSLALRYDFFQKVLLNTNLSTLREDLPEKLKFAQHRLEFNVNLPTTDPDRYRQLHGRDHYQRVERNIQRLHEAGFALRINIQSNKFTTPAEREGVIERFGALASVETISSASRGGLMNVQISEGLEKEPGALAGCAQNRPVDYVHIGIDGEVFLCCQDFFKEYRLGDLTQQHLLDILNSEPARAYLEYIYSGRESPPNFICKRCEFAISNSEGEVR
jgi:radical SAM protein with 4Fe4S-binding SPASM domain